MRVDCDSVTEVTVDAITRCLEVGNFFARTFDERVQAIIGILNATHARIAETTHLTAIGTGSTAVTTGQNLGASRDVLAHLDLLVARAQSRWRLRPEISLRIALPFWVHGLIRADLSRQLPGDQTMSVTDAEIDAMIRARNVDPWFFVDGETGQIFGDQGVGPLNPWPSTMISYLYPEGSWSFLDAGMLDLGIVRDSTLNSTNDLQIFAETFEAVAFRGVESLKVTFDVCPDGTSSGTVDADLCASGS